MVLHELFSMHAGVRHNFRQIPVDNAASSCTFLQIDMAHIHYLHADSFGNEVGMFYGCL